MWTPVEPPTRFQISTDLDVIAVVNQCSLPHMFGSFSSAPRPFMTNEQGEELREEDEKEKEKMTLRELIPM
jgi:hypothetical protein